MTMVAATEELENAVAVALQETQTSQPTQTATHTATHTPHTIEVIGPYPGHTDAARYPVIIIIIYMII